MSRDKLDQESDLNKFIQNISGISPFSSNKFFSKTSLPLMSITLSFLSTRYPLLFTSLPCLSNKVLPTIFRIGWPSAETSKSPSTRLMLNLVNGKIFGNSPSLKCLFKNKIFPYLVQIFPSRFMMQPLWFIMQPALSTITSFPFSSLPLLSLILLVRSRSKTPITSCSSNYLPQQLYNFGINPPWEVNCLQSNLTKP